MADLFLIGQFQGGESITAVSIGSQVMHMITVMLVGLTMRTFLAETAAKKQGGNPPLKANSGRDHRKNEKLLAISEQICYT